MTLLLTFPPYFTPLDQGVIINRYFPRASCVRARGHSAAWVIVPEDPTADTIAHLAQNQVIVLAAA